MSANESNRAISALKLWENPIFRRYCRSRLRLRALLVASLFVVMVAGFIVAMATSIGARGSLDPQDAARGAIMPLLIFQSLILFGLGTAQVSGGMIAERDEGVIDYQRLVPMPPLAKVLGYLFGLPVREYFMCLVSLPFTAWALWTGQVAWDVWIKLYAVVFSSAMVYHFTGLVTGTVAKNRRSAFLISIGLVFCLYTVIPQAAKFGLVFFKYLTIRPVFEECLPGILPADIAAAVEVGQRLVPTVKFFGLDFSETVFTAFTQGGLIFTFVIMLCRKWRNMECHLLDKLGAASFFIWIQILLLGNALPLIDPGNLFPSRGLSRLARIRADWAPNPSEAVLLAGIYGLVTMLFIIFLTLLITPTLDSQMRGWRRARKQGEKSIPWLSDAASSFGFVLVMVIAGAIGWFVFTRGLVESRWFPGHELPLTMVGYYSALLLATCLGFQALLEAKGPSAAGLIAILVGTLPLMVGMVLGTISDSLQPVAAWFFAISPLSLPFFATSGLLSISELPVNLARAIPNALHFWLLTGFIFMLWRSKNLLANHRSMKRLLALPEPEQPEAAGEAAD